MLVIELQTGALAGRKEHVTIEQILIDERIPTLKEQLQLMPMLQHQRQKFISMQFDNLRNIWQQDMLLTNQTDGQRRQRAKDVAIALNAADQILHILLLRADQLVQHVTGTLLGYIAAAWSRARTRAGAGAHAATMLGTELASRSIRAAPRPKPLTQQQHLFLGF